MKFTNLLCALLILTSVTILAQNYFPAKIGDKFQEEHYKKNSFSIGGGWEEYTYPNFDIKDTLMFENVTYYNYNNRYYSYDSLNQRLNIYLDGKVHLAVDFNQPVNAGQVLYFGGDHMSWKSSGVSVKNILGKDRLVYKMTKDSSYFGGPSNRFMEWVVEFVDGIGIYSYYYHVWDMWSSWDEYLTISNKIVFAKVGTSAINFYNQKISLTDPVKDKKLSEFGCILGVDVENPFPSLISKFYVEYNIYRSGLLNATKIYNIDKSTKLAFINPQPGDLSVGDSIAFRCVLRDTSIFNNITTCPDTGYYTYKILSNVSSVEGSEGERVSEYQLGQNYPNPFNPTTIIKYSVVKSGNVSLKIYDVLGNEVATLVNEEKQPGNYKVEFQSTVSNQQLASGIYFYQLRTGDFVQTKKMILLR